MALEFAVLRQRVEEMDGVDGRDLYDLGTVSLGPEVDEGGGAFQQDLRRIVEVKYLPPELHGVDGLGTAVFDLYPFDFKHPRIFPLPGQ